MGQYHIPVNLTKKEFFHPHKLGCGLKLCEMSSGSDGVGAALVLLLAASNGRGGGDFDDDSMVGRWAGDRIAIVGDYAEDTDLPSKFKASEIYGRCWSPDDDEKKPRGAYTDISEDLIKTMEKEMEIVFFGDGWMNKIQLREAIDGFAYTHDVGARVASIHGRNYAVTDLIPPLRAWLSKRPTSEIYGHDGKSIPKVTVEELGVKPYVTPKHV